jgi:hypothetical protein
MEWIVIIAVVCAESQLNAIPATVLPFTPNSLSAVYHYPPPPPTPTMHVVRAASRKEAEEQALGYHESTGTMWCDEKIAVPGLFAGNCSRAAIVIAPDGTHFKVTKVSKTKKVQREVEESDGWEARWEPVK